MLAGHLDCPVGGSSVDHIVEISRVKLAYCASSPLCSNRHFINLVNEEVTCRQFGEGLPTEDRRCCRSSVRDTIDRKRERSWCLKVLVRKTDSQHFVADSKCADTGTSNVRLLKHHTIWYLEYEVRVVWQIVGCVYYKLIRLV